jgi:hypothetical protein
MQNGGVYFYILASPFCISSLILTFRTPRFGEVSPILLPPRSGAILQLGL